jgi:hypothetical protein
MDVGEYPVFNKVPGMFLILFNQNLSFYFLITHIYMFV